MKKLTSTFSALMLSLLITAQAAAQVRESLEDRPTETKFTVQLNPEYATGKYGGSTSIDDQYLGLVMRYDMTSWTLKGTLPYLQTSSDRAFTRIEPGQIHCRRSGTECTTSDPTTTTTLQKQTKSGFADAGASVTYHFPELGNGLSVDLIGRGKFDTASANSGLGSGRNDFSLATGAAYESKNWEPYLEVGYKWRGKSDDPDLLNQTFAVAGSKYNLTPSTGIDLSYDFRTKSFAGDPAARSVALALSSRLDRHWKFEGYYIHGLSDVVADRVIGVTLGYRF